MGVTFYPHQSHMHKWLVDITRIQRFFPVQEDILGGVKRDILFDFFYPNCWFAVLVQCLEPYVVVGGNITS